MISQSHKLTVKSSPISVRYDPAVFEFKFGRVNELGCYFGTRVLCEVSPLYPGLPGLAAITTFAHLDLPRLP